MDENAYELHPCKSLKAAVKKAKELDEYYGGVEYGIKLI